MKYFIGLAMVGVAGYFFFTKEAPKKPATQGAESVPEPLRKPDPTPLMEPAKTSASKIPDVATTPAAPVAPSRRLAPEGTFYVIQRISATTDSGVVAVPVGTKVTVTKAGVPLRVTDGKTEFAVAPNQITNDLDVAGRAYQGMIEQRAQVAMATSSPAQPVAIAAQANDAERARQASAMGEEYARKVRSLIELRSRLSGLVIRETALKKTVTEIRAAYGSRGRITYNGKHPSIDEVEAAEHDLQRASYERGTVENQIGEMQR